MQAEGQVTNSRRSSYDSASWRILRKKLGAPKPSDAAAPSAAPTKSKGPRGVISSKMNLGTNQVAPAQLEHSNTRASFREIDLKSVKSTNVNTEKAPWYILHPYSHFMSSWDCVTTLALLFTAAITPFEVAFLPRPETPSEGLFVVNRILDAIFIVDMLFSFFIMYKVSSESAAGTIWEYRLHKVAAHYLRGWFLLDLLSIIPSAFDILPFYTVAYDSASTLRVGRVVRCTRLIKLLRLARSSRLVKRWRTRVSTTFATLTLCKLGSMLLVITHWLACVLRLQTVFATDGETGTWLGTFGWCYLDEFGEDVCAPPERLYLTCMHSTSC